MSKLNIFRKEWLDIIFENRNKNYGAYQLRLENPRTTMMSFFIGIGLFGGVIGSTVLFNNVQTASASEATPTDFSKVLVLDRVPVEKKEKKEEVREVAENLVKAKTIVLKEKTVVFVKPNVIDDKDVENDMLNMEELLKSNIGNKAADGSGKDGVIDVGEGVVGNKVVDGPDEGAEILESGNGIVMNVQVKASPIGGMNAFSSMFISRFRSPTMNASTSEVKVIVSFVVEKDGSLSDIKVLRDPGFGVGAEAVRVLKGMPKWEPAKQNGAKVRSQFTLPISIKVN